MIIGVSVINPVYQQIVAFLLVERPRDIVGCLFAAIKSLLVNSQFVLAFSVSSLTLLVQAGEELIPNKKNATVTQEYLLTELKPLLGSTTEMLLVHVRQGLDDVSQRGISWAKIACEAFTFFFPFLGDIAGRHTSPAHVELPRRHP